jgi:hypothetical protein
MIKAEDIEVGAKKVVQVEDLNLNFVNHDTLYATHGLHPFAARCPPQLAHWAIEKYTNPRDTILDLFNTTGDKTRLTICEHMFYNQYTGYFSWLLVCGPAVLSFSSGSSDRKT